jgi:hypothetical protein
MSLVLQTVLLEVREHSCRSRVFGIDMRVLTNEAVSRKHETESRRSLDINPADSCSTVRYHSERLSTCTNSSSTTCERSSYWLDISLLFVFPKTLVFYFRECNSAYVAHTFQLVMSLWRMVSSEMLRRVALVRTDISEDLSASSNRCTLRSEVAHGVSSQRASVASYS